jgi:ion channel-forming bestrophin family protein
MANQDSPFSRPQGAVVKRTNIAFPHSAYDDFDGAPSEKLLARPLDIRPIVAPSLREDDAVQRTEVKHASKHLLENHLVNHPETKSFIATAFAWHGSVTPRVLPRVAVAAAYAAFVYGCSTIAPKFSVPVTPFEYSGAVLALILVMRLNAGHDRWWEARKIWGAIVNQSRNLSLVIYGYSANKDENVVSGLKWVAAWPHVMRESLRNEKSLVEVAELVGEQEAIRLRNAENMSMYVGVKITDVLSKLRNNGLDSFAFLRAETERSQLIDAIGACERIRNTRMPLVLAIKTRRFILLFLLLLPLSLVDRAGLLTPLIVALASYPLFSLDEIGAELQNPFSSRNLSHLPLDRICRTISGNVMGLLKK